MILTFLFKEGKCKYFVVAIEEYLLLYNSDAVYGEPRKRVEYSFGKGAIIHDCALMCLEDNFEGLVVGATTVNETGTKCYGLYLLSAGREAIILDALAFAGDVSDWFFFCQIIVLTFSARKFLLFMMNYIRMN